MRITIMNSNKNNNNIILRTIFLLEIKKLFNIRFMIFNSFIDLNY